MTILFGKLPCLVVFTAVCQETQKHLDGMSTCLVGEEGESGGSKLGAKHVVQIFNPCFAQIRITCTEHHGSGMVLT